MIPSAGSEFDVKVKIINRIAPLTGRGTSKRILRFTIGRCCFLSETQEIVGRRCLLRILKFFCVLTLI